METQINAIDIHCQEEVNAIDIHLQKEEVGSRHR